MLTNFLSHVQNFEGSLQDFRTTIEDGFRNLSIKLGWEVMEVFFLWGGFELHDDSFTNLTSSIIRNRR